MDLVIDSDDLLTEILLRLPGRTLIRFTSVSKKWLSIISSDSFRHRHTLRRPTPQPSLLLRTRSPLRFFYFNQTIDGGKVVTPYAHPSIRTLQECNGLLLQQNYSHIIYKRWCEERHRRNSYIVYNPTTKQSRRIALTDSHSHSHPDVAAVALAFDPRKSPYYKIVCVRFNSDSYQIEVYDSETRAWEVKLEAFDCPHKLSSYRGVAYWNDAVYWSYSISFNEVGGYYYCFDVEKGVFREVVPFPDSGLGFCSQSWLQEFDGRIYHVEASDEVSKKDDEDFRVGVWELNDDDDGLNKWELKGYHLIHPHSQHPRSSIVRFMGGGEGPTCCLMAHTDGKMRAYSLVENEYQDVDDFPPQPQDPDYVFGVDAFLFGETLPLV